MGREIVDGKLRLTRTPVENIETLDRDEVVGRREEAQTKVAHLTIDLATAQAEVDQWDADIVEIDKVR